MTSYLIDKAVFDEGAAGLREALIAAHGLKIRPLCLCKTPHPQMYIAMVNGEPVVKRWPDGGNEHASDCQSYDPPPELSGLGQVIGSAIKESEEGVTTLKLNFALTKAAGKKAPAKSGGETDSVKTDGTKLTLRGVLHYLWEQARFNTWTPRMEGKRSWGAIYKYLTQAASDKASKGLSFDEILFLPEPYRQEYKTEIAARRAARLSRATAPTTGPKPLMMLIGEVNEVTASRYGHKIIFKHLPDMHVMLNDDIHKRLCKRFEMEMALWDAVEESHLIAICTFGIGTTGIASAEEIALMVVNKNWIPFESVFEETLIQAMVDSKRRFTKGLRYNMVSTLPLATLVATDTGNPATAMYITPAGACDEYRKALAELVSGSQLSEWIWDTGASGLPALPPVQILDIPS